MLCILTGDKNSPEYIHVIMNESLGKFKISRHTFGMQQEKLVNKDLSRLTKPLINATKEWITSKLQDPLPT